MKIISQTEAGKILGKTKKEIHKMILNGQLKNWGNDHRFMLNENEIEAYKKEGAHKNNE